MELGLQASEWLESILYFFGEDGIYPIRDVTNIFVAFWAAVMFFAWGMRVVSGGIVGNFAEEDTDMTASDGAFPPGTFRPKG